MLFGEPQRGVDGVRHLRLMATQVESPGPAAYMADKAS